MSRVLIVDDEPDIVMALRDELRFEGLEVDAAGDGPAGIRAALTHKPDVLLLDLMLPGMNGFEVCRELRTTLPDLWIIVITARSQEGDRITGFEAGADDYVVKPFSLRELVARVRVGLRRKAAGPRRAVERFGDIEIDLRRRSVTRSGHPVSLTRKEFEILALLAQRDREVVQREDFRQLIWGASVFVTERAIDTHVASLRRKIEADPNSPRHILSVRGVGYKLE